MNSRGQDSGAKKEADPKSCPRITTPSSRQWSSSFKNPRIVRVSRAFGGKDRHSKVCTVRGLRDRRIRLSVPTAIQLYDLQDRLGLSMPSKVVDWLIDATKHEIDKLPPLPMIPSTLSHFHEPSRTFQDNVLEKSKWIESQQEHQSGEGFGGILSAQNFFPVPNMPYNSNYFHWDPPNLSLSQFGGGYSFSNQAEEQSHSSMINLGPPFPSYIPQSMDSDHYFRQINHVQQNPVSPTTLHFITPPVKSSGLSANPSHEEDDRNREKHDNVQKGRFKFLH